MGGVADPLSPTLEPCRQTSSRAFDADHTRSGGILARPVAHNPGIDSIRCRPHPSGGILAGLVAHNPGIDSIRCRPHTIRRHFSRLVAHNLRIDCARLGTRNRKSKTTDLVLNHLSGFRFLISRFSLKRNWALRGSGDRPLPRTGVRRRNLASPLGLTVDVNFSILKGNKGVSGE